MTAHGARAHPRSEDSAGVGGASPTAVEPVLPRAADTDALRRHGEDQARRAFLRAASHELRTPLNAIIGFSEIIARELYGPLNEPRYKEHAQIVRDSGLKLLKLVNQTLEIARLEAGAADLTPRPEAMDLAFAEARKAVQGEFESRGLTLETEIAPQATQVLADNRGLNTILVNLLENAAQFSPRDSRVRMTARPSGGCICIEVQDEGPSVSPSDLNKLLRPFHHGEGAPARGGEGHGLGLAVVNLTCKAMNGRVRLHCGPQGGLIASVRLPPG